MIHFNGTFKVLVCSVTYTTSAYCRSACIQVEVPVQQLYLQWLLQLHLLWLVTAVSLEIFLQKKDIFVVSLEMND